MVNFHVIYWNGQDGVNFGFPISFEDPLRDDNRPSVCFECDGVANVGKYRMDCVHASMSMLAKEGTGFRREVEDFVCLSQRMAIQYKLKEFHAHNRKVQKKVLTEANILSAPMRVEAGEAQPEECGVNLTEFSHSADGLLAAPCQWLREYVTKVRARADVERGASALAVLHADGAEVNGFGVPGAFFAHEPQTPITQVILLLAGPAGFDQGVLEQFEDALMAHGDGNTGGCHVGPLRIAVPSARGRASFAALGELFMFHDRDVLVPTLEDVRLLGAEYFSGWTQLLRGAVCKLGKSPLPFESKMVFLERFGHKLTSENDVFARLRNRRAERTGSAGDDRNDVNAQPLMADVEAKVVELIEDGTLAHKRLSPQGKQIWPWRVRLLFEASEPAFALQALQECLRAKPDSSAEQRWEQLAELLEAGLAEPNKPRVAAPKKRPQSSLLVQGRDAVLAKARSPGVMPRTFAGDTPSRKKPAGDMVPSPPWRNVEARNRPRSVGEPGGRPYGGDRKRIRCGGSRESFASARRHRNIPARDSVTASMLDDSVAAAAPMTPPRAPPGASRARSRSAPRGTFAFRAPPMGKSTIRAKAMPKSATLAKAASMQQRPQSIGTSRCSDADEMYVSSTAAAALPPYAPAAAYVEHAKSGAVDKQPRQSKSSSESRSSGSRALRHNATGTTDRQSSERSSPWEEKGDDGSESLTALDHLIAADRNFDQADHQEDKRPLAISSKRPLPRPAWKDPVEAITLLQRFEAFSEKFGLGESAFEWIQCLPTEDLKVKAMTRFRPKAATNNIFSSFQSFLVTICEQCPSMLQNGYCEKGDDCLRSHAAQAVQATFPKVVCKAWQKGQCTKGDKCWRAHDMDEKEDVGAADIPDWKRVEIPVGPQAPKRRCKDALTEALLESIDAEIDRSRLTNP